VEAIGANEALPAPLKEEIDTAPDSIDHVTMFADNAHHKVPLYDRATMLPGQSVQGPAIIRESTATTVIEPGWCARMDQWEQLILERTVALKREASLGTTADPVMLEVFNNLFMNIAEQMGATLANTAYSVNIKERFDFSCALFDTRGQLVANAPHVP